MKYITFQNVITALVGITGVYICILIIIAPQPYNLILGSLVLNGMFTVLVLFIWGTWSLIQFIKIKHFL